MISKPPEVYAGSTPRYKSVEIGDGGEINRHHQDAEVLSDERMHVMVRDMLRDSCLHTPDRRVDRMASTPLSVNGVDELRRQQTYNRILNMVDDPELQPLTIKEAMDYFDSIADNPLITNTLFPPNEQIAARSIKTTRRYATVLPSRLCDGRGLWLRPDVALAKGDFLGIYIGWVTNTSSVAIWDWEDLDQSYVLGISEMVTEEGNGDLRQAKVHANDRKYPQSHCIFPLACANEWIWQSREHCSDPNTLRFGKYGMVFANRHILASTTKKELTIGLGREGIPFGGWTNYKKSLMGRTLEIIDIIMAIQIQDTSLILSWQQLLDDLQEMLRMIRYDTLPFLREDRSALAILLGGVENESEMDNTVTIVYNSKLSIMDNIRQWVQHTEIRKRCNFRQADEPNRPSTASVGSVKFWTTIYNKESRGRAYLKGVRQSQRVPSRSLSETNVMMLVDSAGRRSNISMLPPSLVVSHSMSLLPLGTNTAPGSRHIYRDQECVILASPSLQLHQCIVRFEDGRQESISAKDLTPSGPMDFVDARWTQEKKSYEIEQVSVPLKIRPIELMYGPDYWIIDECLDPKMNTGGDGLEAIMFDQGTQLRIPNVQVLRVATWNASGIKTMRKLKMAIELMHRSGLDILCIQDARIESGLWSLELIRTAKESLGPGASVFLSPVTARAQGSQGPNVGGQLILKSPRAGVITNFWTDESALGVVCSFDVKMGGADIRVVSLYVPPDKGAISAAFMDEVLDHVDLEHDPVTSFDKEFFARGSLTARLKQFTKVYRPGSTPAEYILGTAQKRIHEHLEATGSSVICVGDFNANGSVKQPLSINGHIEDWTRTMGLLNATSILSQTGECPNTFYRQGTGVSDIDHVLFSRDKGILPIGWRVLEDSLWQMLSNHCPLVIDFELPQFSAVYTSRRKRRGRKKKQRLDIVRKAEGASLLENQIQEIDRYRQYMTRLNQRPALDSQDRLMDIMRVTKAALTSLSRRRRHCSLWSPEMVALTANQIAINEMGRYLEGSKGRRRWTSTTSIEKGMNTILNNWEKQIVKLVESDKRIEKSAMPQWLNLSEKGPDFWRSISWKRDDLLAHIIREKRRLGKLISQRDRQEWNDSAVEKRDRRMLARLQGKHLRELRSLLGAGHTPFSMDYLIVGERMILDQRLIHRKVTQHFSDWFRKSDIAWGFHNPSNDYMKMWKDKEYFIRQHENANIPVHLLEIIWGALQSRQHASVDDLEGFEIFLKAAPTLDEFKEAIRTSPTHSAGGPLDVTYNAVAAWEEGLVEEVHMILSKLWEDRNIPRFWKWRWLVPIPKVEENVTLEDLRPLMLTDVTRKLWMGIVVNKIQNYWRQHGLLSQSQHGFLECKSTEGAILQFRNVLEEARESCTDVFLSSWDIRRAFDRVPKQLLVLGWMRLGVPQEIAEYLVAVDVDGLTVVRTPVAQELWDRMGAGGFQHLETCTSDYLESFSPETGTGQGNIDSPLNWTSIMDILLRALEGGDKHPFYVRSSTAEGITTVPAPDIAYADDLISLTSQLEGLQSKADIVCAFCLVFGMEIAVSKLRAYKVHWGGEHKDDIGLTEEEGNTAHYISLHLYDWTCRRIKVNSFEGAPPIRYLGILFDLNNRDMSSKGQALMTARTLIARLYDRSIDPDMKIDAILLVIYPKLLYAAQFASWSMQDYNEMDSMFSMYFRQFLGLRKTFPAELLYASEAVCGIGLKRFSNEAQMRKIAILFRGLYSDSTTKQATISLLQRGLRVQNRHPIYTQYAALTCQCLNTQPLFIRSIVEWLQIADLRLAKGGIEFEDCSYTNIVDYLLSQGVSVTDEQLQTLEAYGINTVGDLITIGAEEDGHSLRRGRSRSTFRATQYAQGLIGRNIRKNFGTAGIFLGVIRSYEHPWLRIIYEDGDSEDLRIQEVLDLLSEGVELDQTTHAPRWLSYPVGPLSFLYDMLPATPPVIKSILLQRNQCYMSNNSHYHMDEGWIWEILGIQREQVCLRTWSLKLGKALQRPRQGDQVTLVSSSLGAATSIWLPIVDMFVGPDESVSLFRVLLGPDQNSRKKINRSVISIYKQPPIEFSTPEMNVPLFRRLFEEIPHLQGTQCFTDGSLLQDNNPIIESLIPPPQTAPFRQLGEVPTSTGALVARRIDSEALEPSEVMIRVTQGEDVHCGNAYDIELILLTLGCVLRWMAAVFTSPSVIINLFSDCQSAIDKANLTDIQAVRHLGHREHGILLRQIFLSRFETELKVSHVYGHPERRMGNDDSWQHLKGEDAGIYLADKVASRQFQHVECRRPLVETSAKEILLAMRCLEDCVIVNHEGVPILEDPIQLIQHEQFKRYLKTREGIREAKKWTTYITTGPRLCYPSCRRFTARSRRTKLVFNWYLRQEHIHKDEAQFCPLCNANMNGDTEKHLYLYCCDVEIENIRLEMLDKLRKQVYGEISAPQVLLRVLAKLYIMLTETEERHLLWKGLIQRQIWMELMSVLPAYTSLEVTLSRRIVTEIRSILLLMGEGVQAMRRSQWKGTPAPLPPKMTLTPLTKPQKEYISQLGQTRLPTLWGLMSQEEQIDWEVKRRLRKKSHIPPTIRNRRQSIIRPSTTTLLINANGGDSLYRRRSPPLVPACLVIKKLLHTNRKGQG